MTTVAKTAAQWKALLEEKIARGEAEALAYQVTREAATERAFSGKLADHFVLGRYHCVCCDKPLFDSSAKFDAGCGWPSYDEPLAPDAVATREDKSLWMSRTEVLCADCGAHLGHVFPDGPTPTGQRYCMNSAALSFKE